MQQLKEDLKRPIFIIGNPRSGTSLLRLLLTFHPQITIAREGGFMMWLLHEFSNANFNDTNVVVKFADAVFASRKFETWGVSKDLLVEELLNHKITSYSDACAIVYLLYSKKHGKKVRFWGDKNNHYLNHIPQLFDLFPEARFIHIVRDGRDIAASYIELNKLQNTTEYQPELPNEIRDIAASWNNNLSIISDELEQIPESQKIEVRYEDLVRSTNKILKFLCRFLEVEYHDTMLDYHLDKESPFAEPEEFSLWKKRNRQPIDDSRIGYYHNVLTKNEIEQFEKVARNTLLRYNYELNFT